DPGGQTEHRPEALRPGARREHNLFADLDAARRGLERVDAVVAAEGESGHLDTGRDRDALGLTLRHETVDRLLVEGKAAPMLGETDGHALRTPVRKETLHVLVDLPLADDQLRSVADALVAVVDGGEVLLLHLWAERDVPDRVVVIRGGVRLPHLDARL